MITQASIEQSLKPSEAHAQRQRIAVELNEYHAHAEGGAL